MIPNCIFKQNRLDEIGVPYQTLEQDTSESLRITENSGISFIYTLESKYDLRMVITCYMKLGKNVHH